VENSAIRCADFFPQRVRSRQQELVLEVQAIVEKRQMRRQIATLGRLRFLLLLCGVKQSLSTQEKQA
jgi:hypothetical protein